MSRLARVVCADPPWAFGDKLPGKKRGAEKHYRVMTVSDIMRHPLPPLEDDAMLCLWRVGSQQQEALDVVKAWDFVVKSEIVWIKTKPGASEDENEEALEDEKSKAMGMGHYVRNEHEVCLVCTRGKFKVADRGVRSTFRAPRLEHSEKPEKFYALVERLAGPDCEGHLVELFGRRARSGWHVYGDEIPHGYVWTPRRALGDDPIAKPSEITNAQLAEASTAAPPAVTSTTPAHGVEEAGPARGALPAHVTPELGEHPSLTSPEVRKDLLIRAHQDKILSLEEISGDIDEAWITLQYRAPVGWFKSRGTNGIQPPEPEGAIGTLHTVLHCHNVLVTLPEVAAWSPFQRDVARLWAEQGGEKPPFFPTSCAACDRGVPTDDANAFKHTGEGSHCRAGAISPGVKKKKTAVPQAAPEPPSLPPPPADAGSGAASAAVAMKPSAEERTVPLFEF